MIDPNQTREVLIEMEGAAIGSFHQPRTTLIDEVNWQVCRNEFWVMAGHHGSGKSDLLLTAAGLMGPVRGRCTLFGQAMPGLAPAALAARLKTGLVFSDPRLLNHLTLSGNVRLPVCYHLAMNDAEAAACLAPLLEVAGLTEVAERAPGAVGRPWHQRASLARALALGPELLLLDEPLAGLDARHAVWWLEFLRRLHRGEVGSALPGRMTIVVVSGTLDPWCGVATHCAILDGGRLSVRGSLQQAMQDRDQKLREYIPFSGVAFDLPPPI